MARKPPWRLKPYEQLTPTGQLRRLSRMAKKALEAYPFEVVRSKLLNNGENTTFDVRVRQPGASAPTRYILRLHRYRPECAARVRSELAWMQALKASTDIFNVPDAIPTRSGEHAQEVTLEGVPESRVAVLFEFVEGRYQSTYAKSTIQHIAEITATIHKHGQRWTTPEGFLRFRWDIEGLLGENAHWGSPLNAPGLTRTQTDVLTRTCQAIRDILGRDEEQNAAQFGLIHADLHPYNLLHHKGRINVIDFDDSGHGYHHYDIAVFFNAIRRSGKLDNHFQVFCEAYAKILPLNGLDRNRLEMFMLIRRLAQLGWLSGRLDEPDTAEYIPASAERTTTFAKNFLNTLS